MKPNRVWHERPVRHRGETRSALDLPDLKALLRARIGRIEEEHPVPATRERFRVMVLRESHLSPLVRRDHENIQPCQVLNAHRRAVRRLTAILNGRAAARSRKYRFRR